VQLKNTFYGLSFLAVILILASCGNTSPTTKQNPRFSKITEGTLLFQDLNCGPLCDAIEAVTDGKDGRDFSHCGMVIKHGDSLVVIEAIGKQVQASTLEKFFARSGDSISTKNIIAAKLKPQYESLNKYAAKYAVQQIGKKYDDLFNIEDDNFYCSELFYKAYKAANGNQDFFTLQPMTYKDPKTQTFFPAWVDYYKELNAPIPEGQPGLNPGGISRDERLDFINLD
jgi:Permuted papain-like amidase enzyme, YaeF/YiiX, C92 family